MPHFDNRAGIKGGVAVVLVGTVFIGLCIGFLAFQSSTLLGGAPTTQITIDNEATDVTVSVYSMGKYESLEIAFQNQTHIINNTGDYTYEKPDSQNTSKLIIKGVTSSGQKEVIREEEV